MTLKMYQVAIIAPSITHNFNHHFVIHKHFAFIFWNQVINQILYVYLRTVFLYAILFLSENKSTWYYVGSMIVARYLGRNVRAASFVT
jgi:hypothetical protein